MRSHVYGDWEAKIIEGRWCVGKAGAMTTQADAAMVLNAHSSFADGCLAMLTAQQLSKLPIVPPPYE